uniref:Carbohydrate-binding-like fold protein n=1 Tax=Kalanchoe fedtschenkoi TaxID=63787 RepID=A0A7N0VIJ7_KALFE
MATPDRRLFLVFIFCLTASTVTANTVPGCGGFVQASSALIKSRKPSDPKLDYSHITVELRTLDGLVKDRTQCAPNGYYFIPVYDKGSFLIHIKGPNGWSWDPQEVPVNVDHNGCNADEDINFQFTGFSLSGRVIGAVGGESCPAKNGGPSNVNVELLFPNGDLVSSVSTSSTGKYMFTNVVPGKYKLRASHAELDVEAKDSTEVELGFGNGEVDDIFFVSGYEVRGFVVAQGNPILGVDVFLYSEDVSEVECPIDTGSAHGQKKALCRSVSDADGIFKFKSLPCGTYELVPYYKGENTVFDVSPPSISVTVEHHHVTIPQKFQVTGFSIGGRVVDGNGEGVDGAAVLVDGRERSITDNNGYYKLDQVTSSRYTIEATKEHYKFSILKEFLVLPNMASVPDIHAISYNVCGEIRTVSSAYKAKVALTHGPENVKPQVKHTDERGNFCFEVPSGEYRLSALAVASENAPELLFSPPYVDVTVKSPLLNVQFSQALVNIHGTVACKDDCGSSVSVSLISKADTKDEEISTVGLTDHSNTFTFSDVYPGKYKLEVKHVSPEAALSTEDNWCWRQSSVLIDVGAEDVQGIEFVQQGYRFNIISSHDVGVKMFQSNDSPFDLQIKKGSQQICLENPGAYELQFVDSCIFFGSSSINIDTLRPMLIDLTAEKYRVQGEIHIDSSSFNNVFELPETILVDILNEGGAIVESTEAKPVPNERDQITSVYAYSFWSDPGKKYVIVPRDSRNMKKKILFYPRQNNVSVVNDGCQGHQPFLGRLGLYIEGSVSPPISGVHIKILSAGDSLISLLRTGEIALETETDNDGFFISGPLYDDVNYNVEASKPGYYLKPLGQFKFACQKLGQINVSIYSEEANEVFPPALLSLSGEHGYRNNSISKAGGVHLFDNLFPGSFYLRPLLKEYAFSPPAQEIELSSGESREVTFQAIRVAYSATGTVTLVSGQPKVVQVEARSESEGYYEETTTDEFGNYRLRGLYPNTTYSIKVVKKDDSDSSSIERASPEYVVVEVY